jgi:hypothetical protein
MEIPVKTDATMARETLKTVSAVSVLASSWPALLLATVCLLPFLNKPFRIDDPWFLTMARQIVAHPTHPMDFNICWNTGLADGCREAYQFASGNPLMGQIAQGYLLVPTILGGAHEWMAHLTQLVLAWIAIVTMTSLVFRFGWGRWHAMAGALLLVAIPPFLPMAATAMPDILSTTLALIAIERLAAWKAEQKWTQSAVAAVALGLAGFARPHLLLLLPLGAFFLLKDVEPRKVLDQIRQKPRMWIPIFAGCVLIAAVIFTFREHINAHSTMVRPERGWINLFSFLLYFAFPLPLAFCWLVTHVRTKWLRISSLLVALAVLPGLLHRQELLVLLFVLCGLAVLAALLLDSLQRRDHTSLFLVLWILIPLPTILYAQLPIKYLLPCMPAVILLCFQMFEGVSIRFARGVTIALIIAASGYSLLILRSDAEFAEFGRDALYELISPHVASGERVWYPGHYWSMWYAPLAGATLTTTDGPQPKRGDFLVVDQLAAGDLPLLGFPHRTLIKTIFHKYRYGRTMGAGYGLYSNGFGLWLWGFGESEKDRFELWRID